MNPATIALSAITAALEQVATMNECPPRFAHGHAPPPDNPTDQPSSMQDEHLIQEDRRGPSGTIAILVIEADPDERETLRRTLQGAGYTVDAAADDDQGLAALRARHYTMLLLDLRVPQIDGLRVLQALQDDPIARPTVVIVLTTLHQRGHVRAALDAGVDDYLTEPFDRHDLVLRLALWRRRISERRRIGDAAPAATPSLDIRSLGRFSVASGGHIRLHEGGRARKANNLFKYLLTNQDRTVPATEVFHLLWPGVPEDRAATDLRSLLYYLRRLLAVAPPGPPRLDYSGTILALRLQPEDRWDVRDCIAAFAEGAQWYHSGEYARALATYEAGLALYGGDYLIEETYADWATPLRGRMREQWLAALSRVAEIHGARGDQEAQEEVLRRALQADPYREPSYRALMGLLAAQGRSAEALVLYRRLTGLLWEEFQAHPDPETQQLIAQIRQIEQSS